MKRPLVLPRAGAAPRRRAAVLASVVALVATALVPTRVVLVASLAAPSATVNTTADDVDVAPGDGICDTGVPNAEGVPGCSLRAALQEVNGSAVDTVLFAVPATDAGVVGGVVTIAPTSVLPVLTAPVVLDGSTQAGFAGDPVVAVDGSATTGDLLDLTSGASTIRALALYSGADDTIEIRDGGGTRVLGTWIGVRPDGTAVAAGVAGAIAIRAGADGTVIGGVGAGEGNLIAATGGDGVHVLADDVVVEGNRIGVLGDGSPGAVVGDGVRLDGASRAVVRGNTIAHAGGAGVAVVGAAATNAITSNSLHDNGGLGIDLGADGVTPNDPGDGDTGPNDLVNRPVLTRTTPDEVTFELDHAAGDVLVEVFGNPGGADPSGAGEGEVLVGAGTVTHPGGVAVHDIAGLVGLVAFDAVSLTATRVGATLGATSEFSDSELADDHVSVVDDTVVVNDTGDAADAAPGDGSCATGGVNAEGASACTLRAAIEETNAGAGVGGIHFAIPTADAGHDATTGVWTITVGATALPPVTGAALLDGATQPGAATNPLVGTAAPTGVAGTPLPQVRRPAIALDDPSGAGPQVGLEVVTDGATVRGLAIARFPDAVDDGGANLVLRGANVVVEDVALGADPAAPLAPPADGVHTVGDNVLLQPGASGTIRDSLLAWAGGAAVRSGGTQTGPWLLADVEVTGHGATPVAAPPTVQLDGGAGHRLTHVHVHGNAGDGLSDGAGATDLAVDQSSLRDNGGHGALLAGTLGRLTGTVVASNVGDGVRLATSARDIAVTANSVTGNGGLGIDLGGDGVTPNDPLDADDGANGLYNTPVVVATAPGTVTVELDVPAGDVLLELYRNPTEGPDPSGSGEGESLLLATTVTHPGGGPASYELTAPDVTFGDVLSATASAVVGGQAVATSEFSAAALLAQPSPADPTAGARVVRDATGNGRHGQPFGSMTTTDRVEGRIGGALDLDGVDDRVVVRNLDVRGAALTLSAWVAADDVGTDPVVLAKAIGLGAEDLTWRLALELGGPSAAAGSAAVRTSDGVVATTGPQDVPAGGWVHLAATYDGASVGLWRDGRLVATSAHSGSLRPDPDVPFVLGAGTAAGDRPLDGRLDEVRVSDVARSAAWLAAEHATQSDPSAAITVGAVQHAPSSGWATTTDQARTGTHALEAPRDVFSAWLTRDDLDQSGLEVSAWWRLTSLSGIDLGQGVRAGDAAVGAPLLQDEIGLSDPAGFDLGQLDGSRTQLVAPPPGQTPAVDAWQRVTVRIDQTDGLSATADGVDVPATGAVAAGVAPSGSLGFRVGRLDGLSRWWIDDLQVRRLVTPEPVATVRRVELAP